MTMTGTGFALFETEFGLAGIAWTRSGVAATAFPGGEAGAVRTRFARRAPGAAETAPPPAIADVIARIQALVAGSPAEFAEVALDLAGVPEFDARVYAETRRIPRGRTATYGEIARALGDAALAQSVGRALGANPVPVIVPCHRVLGADGRLVGFSAPGGLLAKERLLKIEGALEPGLFD